MRSEISKSPRRVGMTYQEKCVKLQIDRHTVVIEGLIDDPKQIYFFKKALKGLYIKYSSNMDLKLNKHRDGVDLEVAQSMDGFTHWSYVHTDGESLICDLQGVGPTLTDPQIISPDPNLWAMVSNIFFKTMSATPFVKHLDINIQTPKCHSKYKLSQSHPRQPGKSQAAPTKSGGNWALISHLVGEDQGPLPKADIFFSPSSVQGSENTSF
ncbi:hypothetical protein PSTT_12907 [Puccinia striiformis]|uniref:Alpha-type protein kinase domain-containing protein n=1 Tax=Puccinia striiformis TaxID=27350 RepID=A0A2S4UU48_9BASI|nr:hypothetical protein PSTT_12907 [Puccinia striiformis]